MQENPLVDGIMPGAGPDDTALEAADANGQEETTLDAFMDEDQGQEEANPPETQRGEKQGGWIQRRIQEGVQKGLQQALTEERARIAAEYDAKLRPLREAVLIREAEDLVRSGKVASRDLALEYLRLKNGIEQDVPQAQQQMRNERGQFVSREQVQLQAQTQETERYGNMLIAQVKAIEAATGLNVMDVYNADPEVKQRILNREWDFADVAKHMTGQTPSGLPSPTRRPNGGGPAARSVNDLTGEQFSKMQKYLERGGVIDMRQK